MSYSLSSAPSPSSSSPHPPAVHQWTSFLTSFSSLTSRLQSNFSLLPTLPLPSRARLIDNLESDIFTGKHLIEQVEAASSHFPYHLRSKATAQIEGAKGELEGFYSLLLLYQQAHSEGREVTKEEVDLHRRQHTEEGEWREGEGETLTHTPDDGIDDRTHLLSSSTPSSPPPPTFPLTPARLALLSTAAHHSDFSASTNRTSSHLTASAQAGAETAKALQEQRESLQKQREVLRMSQMEVGEGSRSMDRIRWRRLSDKLIAWAVVGLQIGLFCLIAYVKYWKMQ